MRNTNKHRKFSKIKLSKSMAIPKVVIDTGHSQVSNVEIFRKNQDSVARRGSVKSSFIFNTVIGDVVIPTSDISATIRKNLKHVTKW